MRCIETEGVARGACLSTPAALRTTLPIKAIATEGFT